MITHRLTHLVGGVATSLLLLAPTSARAALEFTDPASFLAKMEPGSYYTENFEGTSEGTIGNPTTFKGGAYTFTAGAPGGVTLVGLPTLSLSTVAVGDTLQLSFNDKVSGFGGNFYAIDASGQVTPGSLTVHLADNTERLVDLNAGAATFRGYITGNPDVPIQWVKFTAGANSRPVVDNLTFGRDILIIIPEPATVLAGCLPLIPLGWGFWRSRRQG